MPTLLNNSKTCTNARREGVRSRQSNGLTPRAAISKSHGDSVTEWERRMKHLNPYWHPSRYTVVDYEYD